LQSKFTILQSNFFPAKIFFIFLEKEILAGKNLLRKKINLLYKEGYLFHNVMKFKIKGTHKQCSVNTIFPRRKCAENEIDFPKYKKNKYV
jgi:hypothetical protein